MIQAFLKFLFFKKKYFGRYKHMSYIEATDTPVLDV